MFQNIEENINQTSTNLSGKIEFAQTGLSNTTAVESDQTRDHVRNTLDLINQMKDDLAQEINHVKERVEATTTNLATQIESTQSGLTETTLDQSNQTRNKVDGTTAFINQLQQDLGTTKQDIAKVRIFCVAANPC